MQEVKSAFSFYNKFSASIIAVGIVFLIKVVFKGVAERREAARIEFQLIPGKSQGFRSEGD